MLQNRHQFLTAVALHETIVQQRSLPPPGLRFFESSTGLVELLSTWSLFDTLISVYGVFNQS